MAKRGTTDGRLNLSQFARSAGLTTKTVRCRIKAGDLAPMPTGGYSVADLAQVITALWDTTSNLRRRLGKAEELLKPERQAKAELDRQLVAERVTRARFDNQERRGELISAEDVRQRWQQVAAAVQAHTKNFVEDAILKNCLPNEAAERLRKARRDMLRNVGDELDGTRPGADSEAPS